MTLWLVDEPKAELFTTRSEDELQDVVSRTYRQVLGNIHVNSSQRCTRAESQLRNGSISVREFVAAVGLSDTYRDLFFNRNGQYRFIELNFKHFLGRAPRNQQEIAEHVLIYHTHGYEAEILSYVNNEEYSNAFGEDQVPAPRVQTASGSQNKDYLRSLNLDRGRASSDRAAAMPQVRQIAANLAAAAQVPLTANNQYDSHLVTYVVTYDLSRNSATNRRASSQIRVGFEQLSRQVQVIQRRGGRIRKIRATA